TCLLSCPLSGLSRTFDDDGRCSTRGSDSNGEKNNDLHGDRCSVGGRSGRTWEQQSHPPLPPVCETSVSKALRVRSSRASPRCAGWGHAPSVASPSVLCKRITNITLIAPAGRSGCYRSVRFCRVGGRARWRTPATYTGRRFPPSVRPSAQEIRVRVTSLPV